MSSEELEARADRAPVDQAATFSHGRQNKVTHGA